MPDNLILETISTRIPMLLVPLNLYIITLPFILIHLSPVALFLAGWYPAYKAQANGKGALLWWIYGGCVALYLMIIIIKAVSTTTTFTFEPTLYKLSDQLYTADFSVWARTWAAPFDARGLEFASGVKLVKLHFQDWIPTIYFATAVFLNSSILKKSEIQ